MRINWTEIFYYNKKLGQVRWNIKNLRRVKYRSLAGTVNSRGYRIIQFNKRRVFAHDLVWFFETGKFPTTEVDHRDGCPTNNRFNNLRLASRAQNGRNRSHSYGKIPYMGVTATARGRYLAKLTYNYQPISVGYFQSAVEAAYNRDALAHKLDAVFFSLNFPALIGEYKKFKFSKRLRRRIKEVTR
jgi:hypothetical protein